MPYNRIYTGKTGTMGLKSNMRAFQKLKQTVPFKSLRENCPLDWVRKPMYDSLSSRQQMKETCLECILVIIALFNADM